MITEFECQNSLGGLVNSDNVTDRWGYGVVYLYDGGRLARVREESCHGAQLGV